MAWLAVPENILWEYSTTPDIDKKAVDSYDYAADSGHVLGIRTNNDTTQVYVLARQKSTTNDHPGYGELIKT